jgi:hypothetical protein
MTAQKVTAAADETVTGTHVDLEEMMPDVTNCHPHPIGIEREQQQSSREAEVILDRRP